MGSCNADHRFFVADVAVSEADGTVTVIALCTQCGDFISKSFPITGTRTKKDLLHVPLSR